MRYWLVVLAAALAACGGGSSSSPPAQPIVEDNTPPVITLNGDNPQIIEAGEAYIELGAAATDNLDGDLSSSIVIDASAVDTTRPGSHAVIYQVADAAGNSASENRTVTVQDTTPPIIVLLGENPQFVVAGNKYIELGATATDTVDGDLSDLIEINATDVDMLVGGSYSVTYDVQDAAGNDAATVIRTVRVENIGPVATISSPEDLDVFVSGEAIAFVGSAKDDEDGDLGDAALSWTSDIDGVIGTGTAVATASLTAGTHTITLTATDSGGLSNSTTTLIRVSNDSVESYPPADATKLSELYRIEVKIGDAWVDANAYQYTRSSKVYGWHMDEFPTVHWATVGIAPNASADVRITRLNRASGSEPFVAVEALPSRYNISSVSDADTISFELEQGQKVFVRTNEQDFDTLFVFGNPLKPPVPPNAKYFGPGLYVIGYDYHLQPEEADVYLDGGAWVIGSIHTANITGDLRILGPGILSGEFELWENLQSLPFEQTEHYMLIHAEPAESRSFNALIEGPTLIASPWFNVTLDGIIGTKTVRNLHIISPWTYNTDGLVLGSNITVTNTFVFNGDDTIHAEYLANGDIYVSDCVLGGRNSFLIGYGYFPTADTNFAEASRIDLILQQGVEAFHSQVDGRDSTIVVDNQVYNDIVVDGDVGRLIYMAIEDTPWGNAEPAEGNIRNITFNNITVNGIQEWKSVIQGKDLNNRIDDITFNNLVINGTVVTEANKHLFFEIDEATAQVTFSP